MADDSNDQLVTTETHAGVATIGLDSPANRNALSARLTEQWISALRGADLDDDVHCVVLVHSGSTFCSGIDLGEAQEDASVGPRHLLQVLSAIVNLSVPVVAQIEGHVRAGGMGIVGACDLAVAGPGATFAFTEARLGLAPAVIALTLDEVLNRRAALRYGLTGERLDAQQAERIGLVTCASADPATTVGEFAQFFTASPRQGLRETKQVATASVRRTLVERGPAAVAASARLFDSVVAREQMAGFLRR